MKIDRKKIKTYQWGEENAGKILVRGRTNRPRSVIDDGIDQAVLENYYKEHKDEAKTLEKDKEILDNSYFIEKKD